MKALLSTLFLLSLGALGHSVALSPVIPPTQVTATSATAQVLNLSATAGAQGEYVVGLSSNGGAAAGFRIAWSNGNGLTVTAANLTGTSKGHYIAATTTAQYFGPFTNGTVLLFSGVAASSSVIYDLQKAK